MQNTIDYYQILNINKNASQSEIKAAYRRMVLKYHPDKNSNPNAKQIFQKIQLAYETLSNEALRFQYDSFDAEENGLELKNLFIYYQSLLAEICDKYELSTKDKKEIMNLFNPQDFELINNDLDDAYQILADRILDYLPKFAMKKFTENHPYLAYLLSWLE